MLNDHIPSGINNKSESTSRTPVLSIDDTLFWQKPALSVFFLSSGCRDWRSFPHLQITVCLYFLLFLSAGWKDGDMVYTQIKQIY